MHVNDLVDKAEGDLVSWLTAKIMSKIVLPKILGWLSGPLGWLVSLLAGFVVKYGDLAVFMVVNRVNNHFDGITWGEAALETHKLQQTGATPEEIERAKQAQRDAFDRFMDAE